MFFEVVHLKQTFTKCTILFNCNMGWHCDTGCICAFPNFLTLNGCFLPLHGTIHLVVVVETQCVSFVAENEFMYYSICKGMKASPSLALTFGYPLIAIKILYLFGFNHCILLWESYNYLNIGARIRFHRLKFCRRFSFPLVCVTDTARFILLIRSP